MRQRIIVVFCLFSSLALAACQSASNNGAQTIATARAGEFNVTLSNAKGRLSAGDNEFTVAFTNAAHQPVEVGAITLNFEMPAMGTMPTMRSSAQLTTTPTTGIYNAQVKLEMGGTWQTTVRYRGAAGAGEATFSITAR